MIGMSPYSPFFTSGLLARRRQRRSSLPESSTSSSAYASMHRSVLSLDLQVQPNKPPVPALPPLTLPVVSPLRSHFSSTPSIHSLPSPKPAPTTMLPRIPAPPPPPYQRAPPRLPELPILPALQFPLPPKSRQRPLPSPPPLSPLSPSPVPTTFTDSSRTPFSDDDPSSPILLRSSVLTKPRHLRSKKPNLAIVTDQNHRASVSTVSTRVRRKNRYDALHALEGKRSPPPLPTKSKKSNLNQNPFIKPATFARPNPPLLNKSKTLVSNFISLSDDSDLEPETASSDYSSAPDHLDSDLHLNIQDLDLTDVNPLLEPEDIVLPPTPSPISFFNPHDPPVILKATRFPVSPPLPPPSTAPPQLPTLHPQPTSLAPPRIWTSRVKGPVERPAKFPPTTTHKEKDKSKPSSSSKHRHHHKPKSTSPNPRNHHHYKSFIELDMDDLLDQDVPLDLPSSRVGPDHLKDADLDLFEWRPREDRGLEWI